MTSKEFFFDTVLKEQGAGQSLKILELGCGTARYVPSLLSDYTTVTYVGVEPIKNSFDEAQKNLKDCSAASVYYQLGYDEVEGLEDASFDVVISFSVLEHVKQLERFIKLSSRYLKSGGRMIHRYDLGHALYPTTPKEHLHVWLGNTFPAILPERKFVRYVPHEEVAMLMEKYNGKAPDRYTYHQAPNFKDLEKAFRTQSLPTKSFETIYQWELERSADTHMLPVAVRERLFPTVALWGTKA